MATTALTSTSDFSAILKSHDEFGVEDDPSLSNGMNRHFDDLVIQSGIGISPPMVLALVFCSAVTLSGIVFVIHENLLTTAVAAVVGTVLSMMVLFFMRSRRQKILSEQLPEMIDELARAAKAGRSLEQALIWVSQQIPAPLGNELKLCTRKLELGLDLQAAFEELPHRTGLVATRILTTVLTVHQQTGGDLVSVLDRLAHSLRDRAQFLGRLKAATSASRATAILMLILPPAIVLFFLFRDSEYLTNLFASEWGRRITIAAIVLDLIGAAWVFRILKTSQRV
ncbi:type II secretion system F family protein [Thalassoglobus sp. JC818]|uniref:type II secretion system F family protein n=1 Tax=Thalassoglobus sp. JC818 TaxID=3232136 RepID=UPI00345AB2BB